MNAEIKFEKDLYNKSELKTLFHFTEGLIKNLSVKKEKPNPFYKCASPMKLYAKEDIQEFMNSNVYLTWLEKSEKRRESSRKAVETKKTKTDEMVGAFLKTITVEKLENNYLRKLAMEAKEDWYYRKGDYDSAFNVKNANNETKERWIVNYIRHNLTSYEEALYLTFGKTGASDAYYRINSFIMNKIAETYPQYSNEVKRQLARIQEEKEMILNYKQNSWY